MRVFIDKSFLITSQVLISLFVAKGVLYLFLIMFQCLPIQSIWDLSINGHCMDITAISYTAAAGAILEDIVLLIMPIPELMKLQLGLRKKLALVLMFSIGSFATITSIIRLKYLVLFSHTYDPTWDNSYVIVWSAIEVNVAIICGSLPALMPLIKIIQNHLSESKTIKHIWRYIPRCLTSSARTTAAPEPDIALRQNPRDQKQTLFIGPFETVIKIHNSSSSRDDPET
ncbi:integral membrane protein [Colletotrichum incanum]|uniref:Integral membrane protein n=1 Tax=Colletotrichum incanum TaxID=1573173 RepID=A0A161W9F1_COLIC|nr:integral membrane protein [Colletotrichum incanum]